MVSSEPTVANSGNASQWQTDYVVSVKRAGADVVDASVVIRRNGSAVTLSYAGGATYTAAEVGVPQGAVTLDVEAGADYLRGATAEAPGIHVLEQPLPGNTYSAASDLEVRWSRPSTADEAQLRAADFDLAVQDTGSHAVPALQLGGTGTAMLRLRRTAVQPLTGPTPETFTITSRQEFDFILN